VIRRCSEHGYFRGASCPVCGSKGKFLMSTEEVEGLGRIMAGILRHFPEKFSITMDRNGWVSIRTMVDAIRARRRQYHWLRPHHIEALVATDPKGRYQINDDGFVRATYGHSIDVDLDLPTEDIPEHLYYPVAVEEKDIVLESGLRPTDRKMVHLSLTIEDAKVAASHRLKNPVILDINAGEAIKEGIVIKKAGTTVFITKEVPSKFITVVDPD